MRKIFLNSLLLSFRLRTQKPRHSLLIRSAIVLMAYPLYHLTFKVKISQIQNINLAEYYELVFEDNLVEGEMREFQVGPLRQDSVLVCKVNGLIYCVSNWCPHGGAGAPLSSGFLIGDKVKCPWHNASFSVKTGVFEEGPMLNGLQTFPVDQKGQVVSIKINKNLLNKRRQLIMTKRGNDSNHIVIVGGGMAGQSAAETLRQAGFEGKITMISNENYLPYDRFPLSKLLFSFSNALVTPRDQQFYEEYGIDLITGAQVEHIDVERQMLSFQQQEMYYDKLLIATGGRATRPKVEGADLQNIYTLRTIEDAQKIREAAKKASNIVVVGASFIGMEIASTLKKELKDKAKITVISSSGAPYERVLGSQIGKALQDLGEQYGISFEMNQVVKRFVGSQVVSSVELSTGKQLEADLVILGKGVQPNNEIARNSIMTISEKNQGIVADVFMKAANNVWVVGDIASYPYWVNGDHIRIEHQNEAIRQGYIAAINMLGKPLANYEIPFFWTRVCDRNLSYSGYTTQFDEVIIDGSLESFKFVAYYAKNDKILASASMNVENAQLIISEALKLNLLPKASELKEQKITLEEIKKMLQKQGAACNCMRETVCGRSL